MVTATTTATSNVFVRSEEQMELSTRNNSGFFLNLCVSYGSRGDMVQACQSVAKKIKQGTVQVHEIDEHMFAKHLVTRDIPDPDILIRTSGEYRLSNYLLFELAYTEMFFLDKFWPELTKNDMQEVLKSFHARQRRFGE